MSEHQPTTVEELKMALAEVGLHSDEVGRADDPETRTDEGAVLVRALRDGRCQVVTMGRGYEANSRIFESERVAVEALADQMLRKRMTEPARSPEQRQLDAERAQAFAQSALHDLEQTGERNT